MKKSIGLTAISIIWCHFTLFAQYPQMGRWYMAPNYVNIPTPAAPSIQPVPNPIPTFLQGTPVQQNPATAARVANGMYDLSGNLLFYVADNGVYDYNNTLMGTIPNGGAEVVIVPFGTNDFTAPVCKSRYNVFTTAGGFSNSVRLMRTVVDMVEFTVTSDQIDVLPFDNEFGAIAIGTEHSANNFDRYLYFLAGTGFNPPGEGEIHKLVVKRDGSVGPPSLLFPPAPYPNDGAEIFAQEMDLSPDGEWLVWASYSKVFLGINIPDHKRYHYLQLDANGDYINHTYNQFNAPGGTGAYNYSHYGFRGVEVDQSGTQTNLYIGAGDDGIWGIEIPLINDPPLATDFTHVSGSGLATGFGFSQIELARNGYMYASSDNTGAGSDNIGGFDPLGGPPTILTGLSGQSFTIVDPPVSTFTPTGGVNPPPPSDLYTLPDQIDKQDYNNILTPQVGEAITVSSYTFSGSDTWDGSISSGNPWGIDWNIQNWKPVQVFNELIISGNTSALTIKNMIFKFSPDAKLIINAGSALTLDNSILSSDNSENCPSHNHTWKGVEVWGNSSGSQFVATDEGKLTLKNNSRIEYAEWGARLWNPLDDPSNITSSGGIINVSTNSQIFK